MPIPHLHTFDLALIVVYLLGITLFGLRFRKSQNQDKSLRNYFLADNTAPWWAIALSIVSAETSTLTIISVPGVAFTGDFGFLQIVIGYMLGRVIVAGLFLPRYFAGRMLTAYQLIDQRFGHTLHRVTAGLFLLTRAAAEGVRVFAVSIVVGIAIGTRDVLSIAIISALTLLYTFEGGMAAVIWTDVVQMLIYIGGTLVALFTLGTHVPGGWAHIHAAAGAAGKFHLFHFALNLTQSYTFWAGLLGGTFLTMASHGTDQLMVQRMLAARNLRESQLALLSSGVIIFVQFTLFLLIGAGLYVFYNAAALQPASGAWIAHLSPDRIFPAFIVAEMPVGIAGLLIAAILAAAMSNLSAALNSLSSTTVVDFYRNWRPEADDRERLLISRASTFLWAIVLFTIAVYSAHAGGKGHVVEIGLSIASVAYGCLLGVFLLGTLTKFVTQTGAILGMIVGFALNLAMWLEPASLTHVIPHVAFTWYVLIGALVTFAIGALSSLIFRKQSTTKAAAATIVLLILAATTVSSAQTPTGTPGATSFAPSAKGGTNHDFSAVTTLMDEAIAQNKLPGGVVLIGQDDRILFEHSYGVRKLAGEPGLDGKPSPAEPMTENTIFDMASLTKCLVTTTAILQLYEQGRIASFDDPVAKYLPAFAQNGKQNVTIRELLTHYSGLPPDVPLKDPWGLAAPDKAEGIRRAMASPLVTTPGTHFEYSDINFITLGALVERLSGEPLQVYAQQHIFQPLGMIHTEYLPSASLLAQIAPTTHDNEGTPATNTDFDHLLRGVVNDPTTRRMGGVAGHAGVFSTAADISRFAQALLDKLLYNTGPFPLKQSTLRLATRPEQPATAEHTATVFTPDGQVTRGVAERGFGWDINSAFSRPRGGVFPIGSFGHTGFTGTSLWMDPGSDSYVILLANAIHPRGRPAISHLRGDIASAAALALGIQPPPPTASDDRSDASSLRSNGEITQPTLTGIDVLEAAHFAVLKEIAARHHGHLRLGLLTNQTGLDSHGSRTIDILHTNAAKAVPGLQLTTLFSPEHGIFGKQDTTHLTAEADSASGLPVLSLYGPHDSDRRPKPADLAKLDAVIIDLQDAGARFYTYETVVGYFLEAASAQAASGHPLEIVLLDRPNPIGGLAVQGPVSDPSTPGTFASYVNYMPLPPRHGLTLGELARYFVGERHLNAHLTVIPMQHWSRNEYFDQTGLRWIDPSPNLRSVEAATLYPGVAFLEMTNLSVGRGTATPFELIGAPYLDAPALARYLTARHIPGVTFTPTTFAVADDRNHYPYHGQTIPGLRLSVTNRNALDSPALGLELLSALHHLYPKQFNLARASVLVANQSTMTQLERGEDPAAIESTWQPALHNFEQRRQRYLLYP